MDNVSDLKIIGKLVLKLLVSLSYQTTRYFNPVSQVAIQRMLSGWAHAQGSSVVQREQHEYDVKKKYRKPQSCLYKCLFRVLI